MIAAREVEVLPVSGRGIVTAIATVTEHPVIGSEIEIGIGNATLIHIFRQTEIVDMVVGLEMKVGCEEVGRHSECRMRTTGGGRNSSIRFRRSLPITCTLVNHTNTTTTIMAIIAAGA